MKFQDVISSSIDFTNEAYKRILFPAAQRVIDFFMQPEQAKKLNSQQKGMFAVYAKKDRLTYGRAKAILAEGARLLKESKCYGKRSYKVYGDRAKLLDPNTLVKAYSLVLSNGHSHQDAVATVEALVDMALQGKATPPTFLQVKKPTVPLMNIGQIFPPDPNNVQHLRQLMTVWGVGTRDWQEPNAKQIRDFLDTIAPHVTLYIADKPKGYVCIVVNGQVYAFNGLPLLTYSVGNEIKKGSGNAVYIGPEKVGNDSWQKLFATRSRTQLKKMMDSQGRPLFKSYNRNNKKVRALLKQLKASILSGKTHLIAV